MTLEEIKAKALVLQSECLKEDLIILNRALGSGKLKLQAGNKLQDQTLRKIYDHLGELIDSISENSIENVFAESIYNDLNGQLSDKIK